MAAPDMLFSSFGEFLCEMKAYSVCPAGLWLLLYVKMMFFIPQSHAPACTKVRSQLPTSVESMSHIAFWVG